MEATDKPNFKNGSHNGMCAAWEIVRDVSGGTARMRDKGKSYLPQEPREQDSAYTRRKDRSVFFNAYSRTRDALVGMVFKSDPKLDADVPSEIVKLWENIDLAGSHGDVFTKELFTDAFEGHAFILVDMQPALSAGATLADERAAGRRPYWVKKKGSDAVNWRTEVVNGETILSQITFEEITTEPTGQYGEAKVERYRVFRLEGGIVKWELYKKTTAEGSGEEEKFELEGSGEVVGLDRIPVAVVYGNREGLLRSSPPLLDLAYLNIAHWQEYSDYRNILHVAQVPILVRKGATQEQQAIEIGVGSTVDVPEDGDLKWCEHTGKAIESGRTELQDLEQRMALMGLSMLSQKTDSNITATEIKSNNLQESSDLSTMARSLQDGIEEALRLTAKYLKLEQGGSIKLGVAESDLTLDAQTITALVSAVNSKLLTPETFLNMMARGFPGVELENELDKLKAMPGFGQAAPTPDLVAKMKTGADKILKAPGPTGAQ